MIPEMKQWKSMECKTLNWRLYFSIDLHLNMLTAYYPQMKLAGHARAGSDYAYAKLNPRS